MSCAYDAYELRMPCAYTLGPAMVQHTFSARGVRAGGLLARAPPSSAAARRCSARVCSGRADSLKIHVEKFHMATLIYAKK